VVVGDPAVSALVVAEVYLRANRSHVEQPLAENLDHPVALTLAVEAGSRIGDAVVGPAVRDERVAV
jgi:hypothetical protein